MVNATFSFWDSQTYNIISPASQGSEGNLPPTAKYPTIEDWNNILFNCLQSESSIKEHLKLQSFLQGY